MNIKYIKWLICSLTLVFFACKEDHIISIPSHKLTLNSSENNGNKTEVGARVSLGDISTGIESRKWTIEEGVADIINADNDTESTASVLNFRFLKTGMQNITLSQVFKENAFVGVEDEVNSGKKEFEETFTFEVLEQIKLSNVEAAVLDSNGNTEKLLTLENDALNEVSAGKTVRYSFDVVGQPETIVAESEGANAVEGSEIIDLENNKASIDVKYSKVKNYNVSLTASRLNPVGNGALAFTNLITIVGSTEPVTLESTSIINGKITLAFSREMEASSVNANDFSITLKNKSNVTIPASIQNVAVQSGDATLVDLTLNGETVYDDDIATVSYTKGSFATTDGVLLESFTNQQAISGGGNILVGTDYDFDFEKSGTGIENWRSNTTFCGPCIAENSSYEYSTEQAKTGSTSLKLNVLQGGVAALVNTTTSGVDIEYPIVSGQTYEIGLWAYVPASHNFGPSQVNIRTFTNDGSGALDPGFPSLILNNSTPKDTWVYGSVTASFNSTSAKLIMRIRNNIAGPVQPVSIYLDNITIKAVNPRP